MRYILVPLFLFCSLCIYSQRTVGVFMNDSLSYNGYTLMAPSSSRTTYLIDNCGYIVNTWNSAYRPGQVAYLLETGQLLRTARIGSTFNSGGTGGRIELYDWDGTLSWGADYSSATFHQHHDIEYLPNGNILILAWELKSSAEAIDAGRNPNLTPNNGLWPEHIVEIEMVGTDAYNVVWEWYVWDHLIQDFDATKPDFGVVADHPERIDLNYVPGNPSPDWLHANAIDYNPELDQIAISSRAFNEIWIIDHSTTIQESAGSTGGRWGKGGDLLYRWGNPETYDRGTDADQTLFGQHDINWIEPDRPGEGTLMVFNNGAGRPQGIYSTVDVFSPPTDPQGNYVLQSGAAYGPSELDWQYVSSPPTSLFSSNISGATRLPNGNTLICEGSSGRFHEVTDQGLLVWMYVNPVTAGGPVSQGQPIGNNTVFRVYRYDASFAGLVDKDLTPGDLVELNPIPDECELYEGPTTSVEAPFENEISLYPNPVEDALIIANGTGADLTIRITDATGRNHYFVNSQAEMIRIQTANWPQALYFVTICNGRNQLFFTEKIVKR